MPSSFTGRAGCCFRFQVPGTRKTRALSEVTPASQRSPNARAACLRPSAYGLHSSAVRDLDATQYACTPPPEATRAVGWGILYWVQNAFSAAITSLRLA